jgi:hypothetical protein
VRLLLVNVSRLPFKGPMTATAHQQALVANLQVWTEGFISMCCSLYERVGVVVRVCCLEEQHM